MYEIVKTEWVKALRSGEYKQGKGNLRLPAADGDKFCCLGVLCDIAEKFGLELKTQVKDSIHGHKYVTIDGAHEVLPYSVMKWAGLSKSNPVVKYRDEDGYDLACLNDEMDLNFEEIADVIEEEL